MRDQRGRGLIPTSPKGLVVASEGTPLGSAEGIFEPRRVLERLREEPVR